jgi:hypothetical protein
MCASRAKPRMRERAIPRRILAAHAHAHASRRTAPSPRRRTSAHRAACARCAQTSKTIATRFRTRRLSAVALPRGACARRVRRHWETPATLAWPCSHTPGDHTRACTARPAAKRRAGQKQALTCFDDSLLAMATACRLLPPPVCTGKEVTCVVLAAMRFTGQGGQILGHRPMCPVAAQFHLFTPDSEILSLSGTAV